MLSPVEARCAKAFTPCIPNACFHKPPLIEITKHYVSKKLLLYLRHQLITPGDEISPILLWLTKLKKIPTMPS